MLVGSLASLMGVHRMPGSEIVARPFGEALSAAGLDYASRKSNVMKKKNGINIFN